MLVEHLFKQQTCLKGMAHFFFIAIKNSARFLHHSHQLTTPMKMLLHKSQLPNQEIHHLNRISSTMKKCIQPAKGYFQDKFDLVTGELFQVIAAFKAARIFLPSKVQEMKPTCTAVDELRAFPFLTGQLDALKLELPTLLLPQKIWQTWLTVKC